MGGLATLALHTAGASSVRVPVENILEALSWWGHCRKQKSHSSVYT